MQKMCENCTDTFVCHTENESWPDFDVFSHDGRTFESPQLNVDKSYRHTLLN